MRIMILCARTTAAADQKKAQKIMYPSNSYYNNNCR